MHTGAPHAEEDDAAGGTESIGAPKPSSDLYTLQLLITSFAFFLTFSAWHASQNLQSSLEFPGSLSGRTSLCITYICIMLSSLIGPPVVSLLGAKRCMLFGFLCAALYMIAQLFPHCSTVYPASALFGMSAAPLWVAQGEYTNYLAVQYAQHYGEDQIATIAAFNGIFFGIFEATQVVGNGISSLVFHVSSKDTAGNPSKHTVQLLFLVFISLVAAAILLVAMLLRRVQPLKTLHDALQSAPAEPSSAPVWEDTRRLSSAKSRGAKEDRLSFSGEAEHDAIERLSSQKLLSGTSFAKARRTTWGGKFHRLLEAIRLMMQPRMASLIPLLIANGLARVFVFSDFTQLVVKPQLGEDDIGFAMMAFGFTDAVSSYGFGKLSGSSRSNLILFFGTILHLSCLAFAGFGSFDAYAELKIYTVCAIWGIADGAWYTMIPAHLGAKFVEEPEAAFSVKTLWEAAAAATLLQITDLSLKTKASLVLGAVLLGNVGFLISLALSRNSSHEEGAESGHKGASVGAEPSVHGAINVHEGSNEKPTGVNATSYNELVNCVPNSQASNHEGCNNQAVEP